MNGVFDENKARNLNVEIKPQHIMPCTISMISKLGTNFDMNFYGIPVDTIETVGKTVSLKESALRYELELSDGLSQYSGYIYKKTGVNTLKNFFFIENSYVRIVGSFTKSQESTNFLIIFIENIENRSQVNDFLTRVLVCYYKATQPLKNISSSIIKAIQSIQPSSNGNGATLFQIKDFLSNKYSLTTIEQNCARMLKENSLIKGKNLNSYKLANS